MAVKFLRARMHSCLYEKALTRRQSYHHFVRKLWKAKYALDHNIGPLGFRKNTEEYTYVAILYQIFLT